MNDQVSFLSVLFSQQKNINCNRYPCPCNKTFFVHAILPSGVSAKNNLIYYNQGIDHDQRYCSPSSKLAQYTRHLLFPTHLPPLLLKLGSDVYETHMLSFHSLLINVLTLEIRLISLAFTLAASSLPPPNAGSMGVLPQPTRISHM